MPDTDRTPRRTDHPITYTGLGGTVYVGTGAGVFGYSPLVEAIAIVNPHKDYWIQVRRFAALPASCVLSGTPPNAPHSTQPARIRVYPNQSIRQQGTCEESEAAWAPGPPFFVDGGQGGCDPRAVANGTETAGMRLAGEGAAGDKNERVRRTQSASLKLQ